MRPAQLTEDEWLRLLPSQRDLVRLDLLNYTPPADYQDTLETEMGLKIAIARENVAECLDTRLQNFESAVIHRRKALEMTKQLEIFVTKSAPVDKNEFNTKKCLTSRLQKCLNKVVINLKGILTF